MDTKGLFDLSILESANDDDILNLSINESEQEFANGSMGSPTAEFDKDALTGGKSPSIPGGDKESPTAKPSNGETGPSIPGGDNEKPTAKPADGESGYSEPKSVTLTADTYNDAIDLLQKSFKEAYEITGMLRNATIVERTAEDLQMEYIDDLILESFSEGPIFEAVTREDKKELKSIVKKIRKPVLKTLQGNGISAKKIGFFDKANHIFGDLAGYSGLNKVIGGKMFQMLCTVKCSESDLKKILENINKTFEEDLGKYKILSVYAGGINADSSKMENSNVRNEYLLFVDTDIPSEFKRIDKLVKKESVDDPDTVDDEIMESYMMNILEAISESDELIDEFTDYLVIEEKSELSDKQLDKLMTILGTRSGEIEGHLRKKDIKWFKKRMAGVSGKDVKELKRLLKGLKKGESSPDNIWEALLVLLPKETEEMAKLRTDRADALGGVQRARKRSNDDWDEEVGFIKDDYKETKKALKQRYGIRGK